MKSLRGRVLAAAAAVLAVFVLLTGIALEQAFRDSARSAREERLLGQLYLLMADAEAENGDLALPRHLPEPRFGLPGSGLYGTVLDDSGAPVWRSRSALGMGLPFGGPLPPGERRFDLRRDAEGTSYLVARYGVTWATGPVPIGYTFAVAEDLHAYHRELARFRNSLLGWLGLMAVLMLAALLPTLHWGLAPLRRVATEVAAVESGAREQIRGDYPLELRALTGNLNALLAHERAQQRRLDNALGDLAHSLKNPLAVVRATVDPDRLEPATARLLSEQLARMDHIIGYQLQRARSRTGTAAGLAPPVPVRRLTERLTATLDKVYRDRDIAVQIQVDPDLAFRAVEGDLMELLGNLLDNAYKWARGRARITASNGHTGIEITVEDDGPGIPEDAARRVTERGARADEGTPGHGIGLAVAREICEAYGGGLTIGRSALGGALVRVRMGG